MLLYSRSLFQQPRPRILVVTRGDFITRTALLDLFRARERYDLRVIIVTGDHRARTGMPRLCALWRDGEPHCCAYELAQSGVFSAVANVRRRSGLTVKSLARRCGVRALKTADVNSDVAFAFARAFAPDLLLSVKCPQRIGPRLRELPRCGAINVHASLLPRYAGRAPHVWAMAAGEAIAGSTAHRMDERFDGGAILAQGCVPIDPGVSAFELLRKLARAGGAASLEAIELALNGSAGAAQDSRARSYHSQPTRDTYARFKARGFRLVRKRELISAVRFGEREVRTL